MSAEGTGIGKSIRLVEQLDYCLNSERLDVVLVCFVC